MEIKEFIKIREERFGAVIFDTLSEKVFVTNETGKDILNLLKEGKSKEEIIDILEKKYESQNNEIKIDVNEFIEQLEKNNIISK
ncbi:MAG: PqqD family protein [Candidatus Omnitrophica bacterium]|nr:PqqD family protein [Candidatus Omnitrophota bacterium]